MTDFIDMNHGQQQSMAHRAIHRRLDMVFFVSAAVKAIAFTAVLVWRHWG